MDSEEFSNRREISSLTKRQLSSEPPWPIQLLRIDRILGLFTMRYSWCSDNGGCRLLGQIDQTAIYLTFHRHVLDHNSIRNTHAPMTGGSLYLDCSLQKTQPTSGLQMGWNKPTDGRARLITEVNQTWTMSVFGWVTAWEHHVLLAYPGQRLNYRHLGQHLWNQVALLNA